MSLEEILGFYQGRYFCLSLCAMEFVQWFAEEYILLTYF